MFRLYKDSKNKMFGGVCAGIADATRTDVTFVRVATVLLNLIFRPLIPLYFIFLVLLPEKNDAEKSSVQLDFARLINSLKSKNGKFNIKLWSVIIFSAAVLILFAERFLHVDLKLKYIVIIGLIICGLYLMTTKDLHSNPSKIVISGAALCILALFWLASTSGLLYFPIAMVLSAVVNLWPLILAAVGVSLLLQNKRHVVILWSIVAVITVAVNALNYILILF